MKHWLNDPGGDQNAYQTSLGTSYNASIQRTLNYRAKVVGLLFWSRKAENEKSSSSIETYFKQETRAANDEWRHHHGSVIGNEKWKFDCAEIVKCRKDKRTVSTD